MLPFAVGECYWVETMAWYYVGRVKEVGPLHVIFSAGVKVHDAGDLPTVLATGKFTEGAEVSPYPGEFAIPMWHISEWNPWPFLLPMKRTHDPMKAKE